jgi:hypothetical protein
VNFFGVRLFEEKKMYISPKIRRAADIAVAHPTVELQLGEMIARLGASYLLAFKAEVVAALLAARAAMARARRPGPAGHRRCSAGFP